MSSTSHSRPKGARFSYSAKQEAEIRKTFPIQDPSTWKDVLDDLSRAAAFALAMHRVNQDYPYASHVHAELRGVLVSIAKLGVHTKRILNSELLIMTDRKFHLWHLEKAIFDAGKRAAKQHPRTGRSGKKSEAAVIFVIAASSVWDSYSSRTLPRTANERSPFYKFAQAAIPQPLTGGRKITGVVPKALAIRCGDKSWT